MNQTLRLVTVAAIALFTAGHAQAQQGMKIGKQNIDVKDRRLSPEALWAMGRIGSYAPSPDGNHIAYQVGYYSVKANKSHQVIYMIDTKTSESVLLTQGDKNEAAPQWLDNKTIAFLSGGEVWQMQLDGSNRLQMSNTDGKVEDFKFSPDGQKVILIKSIPFHEIIKENPSDLPKATGRLVTDLMYRHWDHYVESIQHPFLAKVDTSNLKSQISNPEDLLKDQPYECPMEPFGGMEQLAWDPQSQHIAYTCRTKTGTEYSISTDADIFLLNTTRFLHWLNGNERPSDMTTNLCKPANYQAPKVDPTKSLRHQAVNASENLKNNVGYDTNPKFSPDGKYVAWLSMEHDGYESDRNRLCIHELATGKKQYVTESFDSNVDDFCWAPDSKTLYFIGVWHATENLYRTNLKGEVVQLTDCVADFGSLQMLDGKRILAERHDYFSPADLYIITPGKDVKSTKIQQLTTENKHILDKLDRGSVEKRWVTTTDGQQMLYWVVLPPNFDKTKKYPTLLFCEGGPQSPVSQFWSYRWNFFIMASQGYVVIAPNRRGLPGFGSQWCEQISGDWTGQCMKDYLTAIDDAAANLPYVDRDRMGAVGASFGGFSVYYLAGHHDKRFKCFIAHDGAFNLEAMYTETEENWFSNWEYDDAYWNKDRTANADKTYRNSPHRFVDQWDTPILCIHGELDYRINATQGMSAFNAARMRGIEAQLLIFPDENHWVLKPQNGILWQRTYFDWLDRWLKKNSKF